MKEKILSFAKKKGIDKWFQRDNLIILILSGVLLLIIALPTKDSGFAAAQKEASGVESGESGSQGTYITKNQTLVGQSQGTTQDAAQGLEEGLDASLSAYEADLEKRLSQILEGMTGVGQVEVMITLASSQELVVEKDRPMTRSNTSESDGEGGSRSIYQTDSGETTVYSSSGSESEPYVVKTLMPKVEGVLVMAQGAGTGDISMNITEAVQALFDLEAHKIKVLPMKASEK